MKFENIKIYGFESALRGMRNPLESWNKSDSYFGIINYDEYNEIYKIADLYAKTKVQTPAEEDEAFDDEDLYYYKTKLTDDYADWLYRQNGYNVKATYCDFGQADFIGPNDLTLACNLIKAGPEHRKFLRQIFVSVDITAPLYWWKEADTYKVGTTANSTSTMHKMASKPITLDCFEIDDFEQLEFDGGEIETIIGYCEKLRLKYLETKDKCYWKELIRWLPESWLQTRTVTMTYENLLAMCSKGQRRFHKLNEWSGQDNPLKPNFIKFARSLPYAQHFIFLDEIEGNVTDINNFEIL